ncbi:MAG: PHP domain-containing protein [Planctomycetota bacterium]|jgi:predicted metal-dependent phosphoesterase TrpH
MQRSTESEETSLEEERRNGSSPPLRFDLHVHTRERSPCAAVPAVEILRLAAEQGLDGVVFTDHNQSWPEKELKEVRRKAGVDLTVLAGQEITFYGIDFLVFGWDGEHRDFPDREAFVDAVHREGGAAVVAHPFSILYYLDPEIMAGWGVDGVEVFNSLKGAPTPAERDALKAFRLAETAGSDFHRYVFPHRLGDCWTEIDGEVNDIHDLAAAIRARRTRAVGF